MKYLLIFLSLIGFQTFANPSLEGIQSGRYEVHKNPVSKTFANQIKSKKARLPNTETIIEVPTSNSEEKFEISNPVSHFTEEPNVFEQVQSLVHGESESIYNFYLEHAHVEDIRNNRIEVELAPSYLSNESKSSYSYREYSGSFPVLNIKSNVWITPLIGITGHFGISLSADVSTVTSQSRSRTRYEFLDVSMNIRKFFGMSRRASNLEMNLIYSDNKMRVASDDTSHPHLNSVGLGLGLKSRVPMTFNYSWIFGIEYFPDLHHRESQAGVSVSSGPTSDSSRIGCLIGGELKFNRENQFFWGLSASNEKNNFSGSASLVDPSTGLTPSNVSVTNSFYILNLGYRWGQ